jgi:5'-nucleotidase
MFKGAYPTKRGPSYTYKKLAVKRRKVYKCFPMVHAGKEEVSSKLRVLLTNDDGIYAQGLYVLKEALKKDFEVFVVAPEVEMSAVGHAITLHNPIKVKGIKRKGSFFGYAVTGTPADCVKLATQELLCETPPDVVVSGINLGANVGVNLLYSGTVSAATEAAFLGFPAIAVSLDTIKDPDFTFAAKFTRRILRLLSEFPLGNGVALNINIPALPEEEIQGVEITVQGTARFIERFEKRVDPRGNTYYWLTGETPTEDPRPYTDGRVLQSKRISITPIFYDLTHHMAFNQLRSNGQFLKMLWKRGEAD